MAENGDTGHSVQIADFDEDHNLYLIEDELAAILESPECGDNPVCVVSIHGTFRQGKSFLLNFFLLYLMNRGWERGRDWINSIPGNTVIEGFPYDNTDKGVTEGIHMWSKPFLVPINYECRGSSPEYKKHVAVLLVDNQGFHDSKLDTIEFARLFTLSALNSSIILFNVHFQVDEADLKFLDLLVEFGNYVSQDHGSVGDKVFDHLTIVVRDYSRPHLHPFGIAGGNSYISQKLDPTSPESRNFLEARHNIVSLFREPIRGCLLSHPGIRVAEGTGLQDLDSLDIRFKSSVGDLVWSILSADNIQVKTVGNVELTGSDLLERIRSFGEELKENNLNKSKLTYSLVSMERELKLDHLVKGLVSQARDAIAIIAGPEAPNIWREQLEDKLDAIFEETVKSFDSAPKPRDPTLILEARNTLIQELDYTAAKALLDNQFKRSWWRSSWRTVKRHTRAVFKMSASAGVVAGAGIGGAFVRVVPAIPIAAAIGIPVAVAIVGVAGIATVAVTHSLSEIQRRQARSLRRIEIRRRTLDKHPA